MVWVKVNQTGVAPITIVYKGLRGMKLVVSIVYYKIFWG